MRDPLALLHVLRLGSECHEVALHHEASILLAEEERHFLLALIALVSLLVGAHGACLE